MALVTVRTPGNRKYAEGGKRTPGAEEAPKTLAAMRGFFF